MSALHRSPSLFLRFVAAGAVGLVVLLSVFAASPSLHAWLHTHTQAQAAGHPCAPHDEAPASGGDELCAIAQFAHGKSGLAFVPTIFTGPHTEGAAAPVFFKVVTAPGAPAHILPPGCGPPLV